MINDYDGLNIGDLVSALYLETIPESSIRIIDHSSIGKEYCLKLRSDLTAQSPNVRNAGIQDDSIVFEVVMTYDQSLYEIFELAKDDVSLNIGTIDTEHKKIHEGEHFFDGRVLAIPALTTWSWVVETGNKAPHMTFEVSPTNGGVSIMTYEGITANANGTLITPLNNNRLSAIASTVSFRLNPTGISTAGSTTIRTARIGTTGGTSQRTGGNLARTNEVILKKNTKYLLTIENLNNEVCYVNLSHSWYENGI